MATLADVIPMLGRRIQLTAFFMGAVQAEGTDKETNKGYVKNHLQFMCGNAPAKVSFKPDEYKHTLPPVGCVVQLFVEEGSFNNERNQKQSFLNNPGKMIVLADENGVIPAHVAAKIDADKKPQLRAAG